MPYKHKENGHKQHRRGLSALSLENNNNQHCRRVQRANNANACN